MSGADADIYRRYERDLRLYKTSLEEIEKNKRRSWFKDINEMAFDVGVKAGSVISFIETALDHVKREFQNEINEEQLEKFDSFISKLRVPDKENIDIAISEAHALWIMGIDLEFVTTILKAIMVTQK